MHLTGASADALAVLREELDRVLSGGADPARMGDDLFTVSVVLRSEPSLRRVVTDVSLPAEAKQGLVRGLFEGKADRASLELILSAVGRRWRASRDLADSLEHLSEVAVVKSAGSETARLADELFEVAQVVQHDAALRDALSDPARSIDDKSALVSGLLEGRALPATVTLARQSLAGTYRTVGVALATYQKVAAEVHGEGVATVRVAQPLASDEMTRLGNALSRHYGRAVHLNMVVDPDVVGGIRVEIGDDVIDGTLSARLDSARRQLAG